MVSSKQVDSRFNDPNRIPISLVSNRLAHVIKEVLETNQRKLITKAGQALVALCPLTEIAEYEDLKRQLTIDAYKENDPEPV